MKISIITARYAFSGVPLAQQRFSQALATLGHDVDFIIGFINHGYSMPTIDGINIIVMNKKRVISMLMPMVQYLKENNPDVVFSAGDHLNAIILLSAIISRSKAKISCSSRVTPFDTYSKVPFTKRWVLKLFMRAVMDRANALTCVSKDMVDQYRLIFKSTPHVCIYNIINDGHSQKRMNEPVDEEWFSDKSEPVLVAAGMLEMWKGFEDLILAMREVTKKRKARLIILGDGSQRDKLRTLIEELDLGRTIKMVGYVDNPLKYFSRADIFVLSSHVEGLPNVLVEAMMCGCTPVSTNCPTGPREVLQDGKYGYLVPVSDPISLAAGIEKALDNPIPQNLLREAVKPFNEDEVIKRHFNILGLPFKNNTSQCN